MSDDVIEFYRKANAAKEGVDIDVQSPAELIIEQTPAVESVEVLNEIVDNGDPLNKFLLTLSESIKKEKKAVTVVEQEPVIEPIVETASEPINIEPVAVNTEATTVDPLDTFIDKFQNIVKSNREKKVKAATLNFINNLKTASIEEANEKDKQDIVDAEKEQEPVTAEVAPKEVAPVEDKPKEEPQKTKENEETYVKELNAIGKTKKGPKIPKQQNDIKALISQQVEQQTAKITDEVKAYARRILDLGGGGGSVAQQFANGGTMKGDLNVTGQYLSAGVSLQSIFSTTSGGSGGQTDRLVSGTESLILNPDGTVSFPNNTIRPPDDIEIILESENTALSAFTQVALTPHGFFAYDDNGNTITFDSISDSITLKTVNNYSWVFDDQGNVTGPNQTFTIAGTASVTGAILSGGRDLKDIFITQASDSQTLTYTPSSYELSISNGNTVSLASLSSTGGGGDADVNAWVRSNSAAATFTTSVSAPSLSSGSLNTDIYASFGNIANGSNGVFIDNTGVYSSDTHPHIMLVDQAGYGVGNLDFFTYGSPVVTTQNIPTARWYAQDTGNFTGKQAFSIAVGGGPDSALTEVLSICNYGINVCGSLGIQENSSSCQTVIQGTISSGYNQTLCLPDTSGSNGIIALQGRFPNSGLTSNTFYGLSGATCYNSGNDQYYLGGNAGCIFINGGSASIHNTDSGYRGGDSGCIDLRGSDAGSDYTGSGGSIIMRGAGVVGNAGSINTSGDNNANGGSINTSAASYAAGGSINTSGGSIGPGGSINLSNGGGSIAMTICSNSGTPGSINLSSFSDGGIGGSITMVGEAYNSAGNINASASTQYNGGSIDTSAGVNAAGGSISTSNGGGSIVTNGTGCIGLGSASAYQQTMLCGTITSGYNQTLCFPDTAGTGGVVVVGSSTPTTFVNPVTSTGTFLIVNINGSNKAIQLWDYST